MAAPELASCDKLYVRKLTMDDYEREVVGFVREFYSKADVLGKVAGATLEDENGIYTYRARVAIQHHGASFGVFERSCGKLVAVKFNFVHRRQGSSTPTSMLDAEYTPKTLSVKAAAVKRFIEVFYGDVFTDLNTECYMELGMTCVHRDYTKMGLATRLGVLSTHAAVDLGCEYMVSFATSVYSHRIADKMEFKVLREIRYTDYVDPATGKKPFRALAGEPCARIYYKAVPKTFTSKL